MLLIHVSKETLYVVGVHKTCGKVITRDDRMLTLRSYVNLTL
jgi:hypothetical protein